MLSLLLTSVNFEFSSFAEGSFVIALFPDSFLKPEASRKIRRTISVFVIVFIIDKFYETKLSQVESEMKRVCATDRLIFAKIHNLFLSLLKNFCSL